MAKKSTKAAANPKRKRGRPAFEPTAEQRRLVETHAAFGTPQDDICTLIISSVSGKPITGKTLRQKFATELSVAESRANARVVESLFHQAVGRPAQFDGAGKLIREELKPVVAAAIWWTKGRMGWSEKTASEHSGPNGGAIPIRLDSLSDAQLEQLIDRIEGALRNRP